MKTFNRRSKENEVKESTGDVVFCLRHPPRCRVEKTAYNGIWRPRAIDIKNARNFETVQDGREVCSERKQETAVALPIGNVVSGLRHP